MSSNTDLTAVVAAWRDGDDGYIVHPWFFCPADNLRARADRDKVPYPQWAADGLIEATPGNFVDYRVVEDRIRELCQTFNVREIIFDPHLAQQMMNNLGDEGYPVVALRQGWISMAPAVKELERAIFGRKFRHGAHPVLRGNFENIAAEVDRLATHRSTKENPEIGLMARWLPQWRSVHAGLRDGRLVSLRIDLHDIGTQTNFGQAPGGSGCERSGGKCFQWILARR